MMSGTTTGLRTVSSAVRHAAGSSARNRPISATATRFRHFRPVYSGLRSGRSRRRYQACRYQPLHWNHWPVPDTNDQDSAIAFGPFRLFAKSRLLEKDGAPIHLGGRALDILVFLAERAGEVVDKRELIRRIWADVNV